MQLVYSGSAPEVEIDELGPDAIIEAGVPTEIPDALAERLLQQETWSRADGSDQPSTSGGETETPEPDSTGNDSATDQTSQTTPDADGVADAQPDSSEAPQDTTQGGGN